MSEITPVNWGRQADRLVTAGIILGATVIGFQGGKNGIVAPSIIKVAAPKVINEIPVPEIINKIQIPKDSIVIKSEIYSSTTIESPIKCEIINLPKDKELFPILKRAESIDPKQEQIVQKKEIQKKAVQKKEVPIEGEKFPVAK